MSKSGLSRRKFVWVAGAGLVAGAALPLRSVQAAKSSFTYINSSGRNSFWSSPYPIFAEIVKEKSGGEITIVNAGGPEVVGPFQAAEAITNGVFDMGHLINSFYAAAMPEAVCLSSGNAPMSAIRQSGAFDLYGKVMRERLNCAFLAAPISGVGYFIMTKTPITSLADFKGRKMRSLPIYDPFFQALGAATFVIVPSEVYTALERGVVDGLAWSDVGFADYQFQEILKYIMYPTFYNARTGHLMNAPLLDGLPEEQRALLLECAEEAEIAGEAMAKSKSLEEHEQVAKAGVEVTNLPTEEGEAFVALTQDSLWTRIIADSPTYGPQLKELFDAADKNA